MSTTSATGLLTRLADLTGTVVREHGPALRGNMLTAWKKVLVEHGIITRTSNLQQSAIDPAFAEKVITCPEAVEAEIQRMVQPTEQAVVAIVVNAIVAKWEHMQLRGDTEKKGLEQLKVEVSTPGFLQQVLASIIAQGTA